MTRKPPFKASRQLKGNSRSTFVSMSTSRRSSTHSASTVRAARRGPFLDSTSHEAPSEAQPYEPEDPDDDTLNEIIMAVDLTPRGTVGCCYYVAREEKLYFMEDIQWGEVDVVDARKYFSADAHRLY